MPQLTARGTILSLPDAIGRILEEHVKSGPSLGLFDEKLVEVASLKTEALQSLPKGQVAPAPEVKKNVADYGFMPGCPDCGASLTMAEGCISCKSCGFSRCL